MKKQLFLGEIPRKEWVMPIKNGHFVKGEGGFWTSTYSNGGSHWLEWCEREQQYTPSRRELWLLTVDPSARILKINTRSDLIEAHEKYGYTDFGFMKVLDFEKMAEDYDGMWLTRRGEMETRFGLPINLYGWDVESTHWFRWMFNKVENLGELEAIESENP